MTLPDYGREMRRAPADFEHVRDLQVLEGPLVSEFAADGLTYLFIWRDSDDDYNRWLAIPTSKRELALYEARQASLAWLIDRALTAFLADADGDGAFRRWFSLTREDLPDEYRAQPQAYFDPRLRPRGEAREQTILIDGHWTLEGIAATARKFEEVYAAQQLLSANPSARILSDDPFAYHFKSGWVYHHFWQRLKRWVFGSQTRDYKVQYASPGLIQIELHEDLATAVVRSVRALELRIDEIHSMYREIHTWLLAQKSDEEDESGPIEATHAAEGPGPFYGRVVVATSVNNGNVKTALKVFCDALSPISFQRIDLLTKGDPVQSAEVVLSYYRKLRHLALVEMSERGTLVSHSLSLPEPVRAGALVSGETDDGEDGEVEDTE